jgi:phosphoribosylformylglycinamidine synthase
MDGEKKAEIPADSLALGGGAPVYHREWEEPAYYAKNKAFSIDQIDQPNNLLEVAKFISTLPNIASKKWVYEQYDSMVGTINQGTNGPSDASIVKIRDTKRSLALTTDCNSRYVWADPEKGTAIAVSEAARNIVCSGGTPSAVTNCLNFGNPYDKGVYWQFKNAILGMKAACEKFQTPVTGGNVSFYNQDSKGNAVFPTPTIGMIGIIDDEKHITTLGFKNEGDVIIMLGENKDDINSSQYLVKYHQVENSPCPYFDLDAEAALQDNLLNLIKKGVVKSAHDCSEGGLFTALLESGMSGNLGFSAVKDESISRSDSFWFGEAQSRVVISVDKDEVERVKSMIKVPHTVLGEVTAGELSIDQSNWGSITDWKIEYDSALAKALA